MTPPMGVVQRHLPCPSRRSRSICRVDQLESGHEKLDVLRCNVWENDIFTLDLQSFLVQLRLQSFPGLLENSRCSVVIRLLYHCGLMDRSHRRWSGWRTEWSTFSLRIDQSDGRCLSCGCDNRCSFSGMEGGWAHLWRCWYCRGRIDKSD